MITTYEFPNQWNWRIFLAICDQDESLNDITLHLKNKESCYINNKLDEADFPCFMCDPIDLIGVVCINNFKLNSKEISICVHELIHLMIYISDVSGCKVNLETSECWAYFIGNMTHMMIEILNQHFNENNDEKELSNV